MAPDPATIRNALTVHCESLLARPTPSTTPVYCVPRDLARRMVLYGLNQGRLNRNVLKLFAPYEDYTELCEELEAEGLIVANQHAGENMLHYDITEAGSEQVGGG